MSDSKKATASDRQVIQAISSDEVQPIKRSSRRDAEKTPNKSGTNEESEEEEAIQTIKRLNDELDPIVIDAPASWHTTWKWDECCAQPGGSDLCEYLLLSTAPCSHPLTQVGGHTAVAVSSLLKTRASLVETIHPHSGAHFAALSHRLWSPGRIDGS